MRALIPVCLSLFFCAPAADAANPFFSNDSGTRIGTGWHGPHVLGGKDGILYLVTGDLKLHWYRADNLGNERADGDVHESWANGSGNVVGTGWDAVYVFGGYDGVIYMVDWEGRLKWYKREPGDAENWHPESGTVIGDGGWRMSKVFGGKDGVIYAVENGELIRYEHSGDPSRGIHGWDSSETVIATGWDEYDMLQADGDGVILGRKPNGDLYYHRWLDDEQRWMIPGEKIGAGWGEFSSIHMGPNGTVYAQRQDGALLYYEIIKSPTPIPPPLMRLADLGMNQAFKMRNMDTGEFFRVDGSSSSSYDGGATLAMGQCWNPNDNEAYLEIADAGWTDDSLYRVFALRTADGGDVKFHIGDFNQVTSRAVYDLDQPFYAGVNLIRDEGDGRFSLWAFPTNLDNEFLRMGGSVARTGQLGAGRQARTSLYDGDGVYWQLYPEPDVPVVVADPPTTRLDGSPIPPPVDLPDLSNQEYNFDGSSSQTIGQYTLPTSINLMGEIRVDASDQWDHVLELGTVEYEWNAPLRLEVGNEGQWYVAVGDGDSYVETQFEGGWRYGQWQRFSLAYDSTTGELLFYEITPASSVDGQQGYLLGSHDGRTTMAGGPDISDVEGTLILGSRKGADRHFQGALRNVVLQGHYK